MDCSSFSDNLYDYIDGNLPKEMQQEMNEHCASCPACKELVELEKKIHQSLQGLPQPKIPKDFAESINQRININERKHKIFLLQRIVRNPVMYSAIAACILLAVVLQLDFPFKKEDKLSEDLNPQVKMAQESQSVSGTTDVMAIAETAIPTEAAAAESPAPEETVIPTEEPTKTATPAPSATPKPSPTNQPTKPPVSTPVPSQGNTTVAPVQTPVPVVQEQAPAVVSYQAEAEQSAKIATQDSANASGGGGGSSAAARTSDAGSAATPNPTPAAVIGRITVKAEQYSDAKRLAAQYGDYSNHIYEMSQSQMNQFLKAMKDAGISYVDRASGTTKFRLVSE